MGNLTEAFGGSFKVVQQHQESTDLQFRDAIERAGLDAPDEIVGDGRIHRFNSGGSNHRDRTGWYVFYDDHKPSAGMFGCWKSGIEEKFCAKMDREPTAVELMRNTKKMEEARKQRDEERKKGYEVNANVVSRIWETTTPASKEHPYLVKKGIKAHGARVTGDGRLVLPLYTPEGELASLQYIDVMNEKRPKAFHTGAKAGGCLHRIGPEGTKAFLVEGFADAATVVEETNCPCYIAYSGHNMTTVAKTIKEMGSHGEIIVISDNDNHGKGQEYAQSAAKAIGARCIIPPKQGDINDFRQGGGDVKSLIMEQDKKIVNWLVGADEFCSKPAPIAWLVKGWLQQEALLMVHGPSGGGKTFLVLDMALRVASDKSDWHGHNVKNGNVVYLAGEGHHGLKGRIAGWKQHHGVNKLNFWVSKSGCDLNTPEGYLLALESIKSAGIVPSLIIVDTLHRFLNGDENSSVDAKTMLDACSGIMGEFGCAVLLVHHTGVSEGAKDRARGSSAWRGALDIEISVQPGNANKNEPMTIKQMKSKDAELSQEKNFSIESCAIDGWFDEDGEQVTTGVLEPAIVDKKDAVKPARYKKQLEKAWLASARRWEGGRPVLERSDLMDYLISEESMTEANAKQELKPSLPRLSGTLLKENVISKSEDGKLIIVVDEGLMSMFRLIGSR
jgi:putative DNA primase/helicase